MKVNHLEGSSVAIWTQCRGRSSTRALWRPKYIVSQQRTAFAGTVSGTVQTRSRSMVADTLSRAAMRHARPFAALKLAMAEA